MDEKIIKDSEVLDLVEPVSREKFSARTSFHLWWARLPATIARTAVYVNLVPRSEDTTLMLDEFGQHPLSEETIDKAVQYIAEEFYSNLEDSSIQKTPRLLDPFSGSGSIPLAASHFGVEAHGIDVNPVAYLLQLCRLIYPQSFGEPSEHFRGVGTGGMWAGLAAEVEHWTEWLEKEVRKQVDDIYLLVDSDNKAAKQRSPLAYFWSYFTKCENPACGVRFPLISNPFLVKKANRLLAYEPVLDEANRTISVSISDQPSDDNLQTLKRGKVVCPTCGSHELLSSANIQEPQMIAVLETSEVSGEYVYRDVQEEGYPQEEFLEQRIDSLLNEIETFPLDETLPSIYGGQRYGIDTYGKIFNKRQLLFLLTAAKSVPLAHGRMLSQRYEPERAKAVTTYLGLILSNLVNYQNKLCRWQAMTEQPQPIFSRLAPAMVWNFVEINPFAYKKSFDASAKHFLRTIESAAKSRATPTIRCASATELPYPSSHFDGVVTAAPYYDSVPYGDLSKLYFIWLKSSIGHLYPSEFGTDFPSMNNEIFLSTEMGREEGIADYKDKLGRALSEVERVLKSGRLLTMIVPRSEASVLQVILDLAQAAGLELVDMKRISTFRTKIENENHEYQALLTFRKNRLVQRASQALVDAAAVLKLTDEDEPSLSTGLAHLLMDHLDEEDVENIIPSDYRGSLEARLIEFTYDCQNPGDLLDELGNAKLRRIIKEKELTEESVNPKDAILKSFGFNIPEPEQPGVVSLSNELLALISKAKLAPSIEDLRGIFLTAATNLESILKKSIWAWSTVVFDTERDNQLRNALGREKELSRLSMGDYKDLLINLPSHVVNQGYGDQADQIFRRPHLYTTKKLEKNLGPIVEFRNRVEHNKEEYLTQTPIEKIRKDIEAKMESIYSVLGDMKERGAIPLIARPVRQTIDVFGRRSYELTVEGNTFMQVYMTEDLALGHDYYLFKTESNPKPVDPPIILVSDVLGDLP